jgi:hypothetical protein
MFALTNHEATLDDRGRQLRWLLWVFGVVHEHEVIHWHSENKCPG